MLVVIEIGDRLHVSPNQALIVGKNLLVEQIAGPAGVVHQIEILVHVIHFIRHKKIVTIVVDSGLKYLNGDLYGR